MTMKSKQTKKERLDEVQAAQRMVRAFTEKYEQPRDPEENPISQPDQPADAAPTKTKSSR